VAVPFALPRALRHGAAPADPYTARAACGPLVGFNIMELIVTSFIAALALVVGHLAVLVRNRLA